MKRSQWYLAVEVVNKQNKCANEQNQRKTKKHQKGCTDTYREVKCTCTNKVDFIFEVNTAILEAFWISELREWNNMGLW